MLLNTLVTVQRSSSSLVAPFLLVFGAFVRDRRCRPEWWLAYRQSLALYEELQHEAGDLSQSDGRWVASYSQAKANHLEIFSTSLIKSVLDRDDLSYLRAACGHAGAAIEALIQVIQTLQHDTHDNSEVQQFIRQAGELLWGVSRPLLPLSHWWGYQPILFCRDNKVNRDIQKLAADHIHLLQGKVEELTEKLNRFLLPNDTNDISSNGHRINALVDDLLENCTAACRLSRLTYVFLFTVIDLPTGAEPSANHSENGNARHERLSYRLRHGCRQTIVMLRLAAR